LAQGDLFALSYSPRPIQRAPSARPATILWYVLRRGVGQSIRAALSSDGSLRSPLCHNRRAAPFLRPSKARRVRWTCNFGHPSVQSMREGGTVVGLTKVTPRVHHSVALVADRAGFRAQPAFPSRLMRSWYARPGGQHGEAVFSDPPPFPRGIRPLPDFVF